MPPSCDQTGVPPDEGFSHFHSSTTSGSASWMSARTLVSVSPRQSPSSLILLLIFSEATAVSASGVAAMCESYAPTTSGAEVGEDGKHAPVILVRWPQVELREDVAHVLFHRTFAHHELRGNRGVGTSPGHQLEHLPLACGQLRQR